MGWRRGWNGLHGGHRILLLFGGTFLALGVGLILIGGSWQGLHRIGMGMTALVPLLLVLAYQKKRYGSGPRVDERLVAIQTRARAIGATVFLVLMALIFVVPAYWATLWRDEKTLTISMRWWVYLFLIPLFLSALVQHAAAWWIRRQEEIETDA